MADAELTPPTERTCERCGREDAWDDEVGNWQIVDEGGERHAGDPFCLHEWDVTAEYNPFGE